MADFQTNSNIPLLAQASNPLAAIQGGLQLGQQIQQMPLQNQLLQQRADQGQAQAAQVEENRVLTSIAQGAQEVLPLIESGDFRGANQLLQERRRRLVSEGKDTSDTDIALQALESGDATLIQRIKTQGQTAIDIATSRDLIDVTGGSSGLSAEGRTFENLKKNLSPELQDKADQIKLGLLPKASLSAAERIALDPVLKAAVAELDELKAEKKALGKAKGELKGAPLIAEAKSTIATAVKLATAEASARGEALSDLKKAEAGLPGLEEVVGKLRELSTVATFTLTGKAFNLISKEFGFGATKGGTARAAYQATIDNQVLPLLKQTFGAAMTEGEGKRLAATLGDVDATPEEKQAQLDAFLDSQKRQIENLKREVAPADFTSSSGITFTVN